MLQCLVYSFLLRLRSLSEVLKLRLLSPYLHQLFLELVDARCQVCGQLVFHVGEEQLLVRLLIVFKLLHGGVLSLFYLHFSWKFLFIIDVRMLLIKVLSEIMLTLEEFGAVGALHGSMAGLAILWDLDQVLVGGQSFLLHLVFLLQVANLRVVFLNLVSDALRGLDGALVLEVEGSCEALEVVLGVDQVLNAHLGQLEQLDEVVVPEPFHVFAVQLGVGDVLEQAFELPQVNRLGDLSEVRVHDLAPVQAARALLELELWRHGSIEAVVDASREQILARILDACKLQATVDVCSAKSCLLG